MSIICRLSSTYGPAKLSLARKSRCESFLLCWQKSLYRTLSRQSLKHCAEGDTIQISYIESGRERERYHHALPRVHPSRAQVKREQAGSRQREGGRTTDLIRLKLSAKHGFLWKSTLLAHATPLTASSPGVTAPFKNRVYSVCPQCRRKVPKLSRNASHALRNKRIFLVPPLPLNAGST